MVEGTEEDGESLQLFLTFRKISNIPSLSSDKKKNIYIFFFQNEAVTAFRKARHQYFQRCEELEKLKVISAKAIDDSLGIKTLDKRRKSKDEAQTKVMSQQ